MTNEENRRKDHEGLDAVMNALVDQRRKIVRKANEGFKNSDAVPPGLADELAKVQDGINAVALAIRQERMFSAMCKPWDYLLLPPSKMNEDIDVV